MKCSKNKQLIKQYKFNLAIISRRGFHDVIMPLKFRRIQKVALPSHDLEPF